MMFKFGKTKIEKELEKVVQSVNNLEPELKDLSDQQILQKSQELKKEVQNGKSLDEALPLAFGLSREAGKRTLNQRHFDTQIVTGYILHSGSIAEMKTGEGKTLAVTSPAYLNALEGKGVHIVTVNEYLAKRDTVWMGQVYHFLGLSVACLVHDGAVMYDPTYKIPEDTEKMIDEERDTTGSFLVQEDYLRPISRKEAYEADITHGTNHEFGFDYLRDNLQQSLEGQVQKIPNYAVIDEVDSILIDEARTPLIIAAPDKESSSHYKMFNRIVGTLKKDVDYIVDEKLKVADITEEGIDKVEKAANIENIYAPENIRLNHYLQECLRAHSLFKKDGEYVVKNNEIIIVDQFTGRLMPGRRYNGGLHQAIEAKEGVAIQQESRTYASVSIQNYFRLYERLSGMTGTAQTSAEEFHKVYNLEVVSIPPRTPLIRDDKVDLIYKTKDAKYRAITEDVKEKNKKGQPVLIGTVSIEKNEELSKYLKAAGLPVNVLNAKNNEREGSIIAQAGRLGAITVATNMAGRGVDIILGGNPPEILDNQKVKDAGGLHVIGTERHESRRIDNQLRGRAGRQGDPGSSQFFLSVEDDLVRVFGGERIGNMMERFNFPEDQPIQAKILNKSISGAQSKVEGRNFDSRKHLLEYDDVLNKQRMAIYKKRQNLLVEKVHPLMLAALDMLWMNHLEDMEALQESVRLRAVGQHDPLVEYRKDGRIYYEQLLVNFKDWIEKNKERMEEPVQAKPAENKFDTPQSTGDVARVSGDKKVGRNDPCPCGSGKKYKKCHGK